MKIAIGYNTSHYAWMFRASLIKKLIEIGHSVVVIAPTDRYSDNFKRIGAKHIHININMNKNPFSDFAIGITFYKLLKKEGVEVFLGYTIKPNIYGSIAAQMLDIKVLNNIAGLGSTFINNGITTRIVKLLYKISLAKSYRVFFQNKDDMEMFVTERIVEARNTDLLPGSGVDLKKYTPAPFRNPSDEFRFLLIARMLWDKGVMEYVNAARLLKKKNKNIQFKLLGPLDVANPAAITKDEVAAWVREGVVDYLGVSDDVRYEISNVDCLVLPSYREGTPRSLLEAAAMGKPLITTSAVGCKEVVDHNFNGYLCKARDHLDLADQMMRMASLSTKELRIMGGNSRNKVESQFDENIVLGKYLHTISQLERPN